MAHCADFQGKSAGQKEMAYWLYTVRINNKPKERKINFEKWFVCMCVLKEPTTLRNHRQLQKMRAGHSHCQASTAPPVGESVPDPTAVRQFSDVAVGWLAEDLHAQLNKEEPCTRQWAKSPSSQGTDSPIHWPKECGTLWVTGRACHGLGKIWDELRVTPRPTEAKAPYTL